MSQRGTLILFIFVLIVGVLIGGWFYIIERKSKMGPAEPEIVPVATEDAFPQSQKTEVSGQDQSSRDGGTYQSTRYRFALRYPNTWHYTVDAENFIRFFHTERQPSLGEIDVLIRENPQHLAIRSFYNGANAPDLFQDASRGYEEKIIGNNHGILFHGVLGFVGATVFVVSWDNFIFEFSDIDETQQSTGVFDAMVSSLRRL